VGVKDKRPKLTPENAFVLMKLIVAQLDQKVPDFCKN
jgi:hypothetical protein